MATFKPQPVSQPNAVLDFLAKNGGTQQKVNLFGNQPLTGDARYSATDPDASSQDFLSWAVDILSRPEFAVTETASSIADLFDKNQQFDPMSAVGHVLSAPFRGAFSTAPEDKIYGAGLIDKLAAIGNQDNPNWKPAEDNLGNNIAKGAAGLSLDILLDPLTYLTFGGSAAVKAAKAAKEGTKVAETAGQAFAKTPEGQSAVKALEESGALQNGVAVRQDDIPTINTSSLLDSYRGNLDSGKTYGLNIYDNSGSSFKKGTNNYGYSAGQFKSKEAAIAALAKLQDEVGGNWVDNLAQDGIVSTKDLPKGTATYSIDELVTDIPKTGKLPSPVATQLDEAVPVTDAGQQAGLRGFINAAKRPEGAASNTKSLGVIRDIMRGREATDATITTGKALTAAEHKAKILENIRTNGYRALTATEKVEADAGLAVAAREVGTGSLLRRYDELTAEIEGIAKTINMTSKQIDAIRNAAMAGDAGAIAAMRNMEPTLQKMTAVAKKRSAIKESLDEDLADLYRNYKKSMKENGAASIYGEKVTVTAGKLSPMETLQALTLENKALLESVFGKAALNTLRSMTNPRTFEQTMVDVRRLFEKSGLLDDALVKAELDRTTRLNVQRAVLKHIGVDYSAYKNRVLASRRILMDGTSFGKSESVQQTVVRLTAENLQQNSAKYGLAGREDLFLRLTETIVPDAIAKVLEKNWNIEKLKDMYKYITKYGVLRTHKRYGVGKGIDPTVFNSYKQWEMYKAINEAVHADLKKLLAQNVGGRDFAGLKLKYTLAGMRMADDALRQMGIPILIDFQGKKVALSFADVIETIANQTFKTDLLTETGKVSKAGKTGPTYMELAFFNPETALAPTKFLDAVMVMLNGGNKAEIVEMLGSTATRTGKGTIQNKWSTNGTLGRYRHTSPKELEAAAKAGKPIAYVKGSKAGKASEGGGVYVEWNGKSVKSTMADMLIKSKAELEARAIANIENLKQITDADSLVIAEKAMETLQALAKDPRNLPDLLAFLKTPQTYVTDAAATVGSSVAAAASASLRTELAVGEHVTTAVEDAFSKAQAFREALARMPKKPKEALADKYFREFMAKQNAKAADNTIDDLRDIDDAAAAKVASGEYKAADIEEIQQVDTSIATKELGYDAGAAINLGIIRLNMGGAMRFFKNNYLMENGAIDLFKLTRMGSVIHSELLGRRVLGLREMAKRFNTVLPDGKTTVLSKAFYDLQKGVTPTDPVIKEAFDELSKHMSEFFDLTLGGKDALFGNQFFRTGQGIEYINQMLKQYDVLALGSESKYVDDLFDIEKAAKEIPEGGDLLTAAAGQWRQWKVDNPLDFISRLNAAATHMATDVSVVSAFVRDGKKLGFVSNQPVAGWVKLVSSKKSRYTALLPSNVFVEPEVAKMFHRMEEVGSASANFKGKFGEWTRNFYDPLQSAWKTGITVYRPGHHFRNLFGDESMTYLAEGSAYYGKSVGLALQLMASRTSYEGLDLIAVLTNYGKRNQDGLINELNSLGNLEVKAGGDVITSGKYGKLTADELFGAIHGRGLLPSSAVIEDIYRAEGTAGKFEDLVTKISLRDTKFGAFWGGISEGRDHFSRIKHFMQIVEKAQNGHKSVPVFKTTEELYEYAAKQVMKYHPDASLLTTGERMVARRLIPFYSWMSRALPAVTGAALTNPGRVQMFNKASYNLAIAMGVNPDSMYDPFPDNHLFPSFLTEKSQGPQFKADGKYYSVNPGLVTWDLANTFAPGLPGSGEPSIAGALSPISGQLSPLLRMPLEFVTGTSLGTGSKINDLSDYVDQNIPGLNYAASISGYSPTGSIASMLQGMGPDPMFQVSEGNRTPQSQVFSLINYLTGIGLAEYSKPNYINYAEIEKRNREAPKDRSAY